jgi:hypothetical protein
MTTQLLILNPFKLQATIWPQVPPPPRRHTLVIRSVLIVGFSHVSLNRAAQTKGVNTPTHHGVSSILSITDMSHILSYYNKDRSELTEGREEGRFKEKKEKKTLPAKCRMCVGGSAWSGACEEKKILSRQCTINLHTGQILRRVPYMHISISAYASCRLPVAQHELEIHSCKATTARRQFSSGLF